MYYLLTGGPPFPGGTFAQRILKHQIDQPDPIQKHRKDCPDILVDACQRMMQKAPEDRFQSAGEIDALLTNWMKQDAQAAKPIEIVVADSDRAADPIEPEPIRIDTNISESDTKTLDASVHAEPPPPANVPVKVETNSSVVERRKLAASRSSVKAPVMLWVVMGLLALTCIVLVVLVLMKNR